MIGQRIQETLRFWSRNIPALLLVTLPFALTSELIQGVLGPALHADDEGIRVGTTQTIQRKSATRGIQFHRESSALSS